MKRRLHIAFLTWLETREFLRRWPWIDYILGLIEVLWAMQAFLDWRQIVTTSKFFSLWYLVHPVAVVALAAGAGQLISAHLHWKKARRIFAYTGLLVYLSLAWNIETRTGHISWGGWAFLEGLVCLAILEP
ncbi:hypothetical protein [Kozakia baliensis]|uniref:Uncharacterized protein n=1 Tax=Kozakia baliensis TaxID=153496 RepID=A0A1D8UTF2_9PROT|nr:hypothetical protein [Kozakia baliensis]AOX16909.1 hypothetical protein A0U89_06920 [Kozakia baliensis]GBR25634.1 hypothetical protein AA0488_0701 [Kozakia baliensis NRIC 0488]GEL64044.1 hypothetical protein KBA01_13300 [Kozakia baliensis]